MLVLTQEQMKALDSAAIHEFSIPSLILMEYAAKAAHDYITERFLRNSTISIVCGKGNNGADGLCLARQLWHSNYRPLVCLIGNADALTEEGKTHHASLLSLGCSIYEVCGQDNKTERSPATKEAPSSTLSDQNREIDLHTFEKMIAFSSLVVDGIFGISLNRPIEGVYKKVIDIINKTKKTSGATILSLDIPSGIETDTGNILGTAISADVTITFAYPKIGLYTSQGAKYAGTIVSSDIGIPKEAEQKLQNTVQKYPIKTLSKEAFEDLPTRNPYGHKGSFGRILIVAGSKDMGGAAMLSAKAAYRYGTGLVYVLTHTDNGQSILNFVPEAIVHTYDDFTPKKELKTIVAELNEKVDAVVVGSGLSTDENARLLTEECLLVKQPLLLDADALNIVSKDKTLKEKIKKRQTLTVLTPHLGEAERLSETPKKVIEENIVTFAKTYATTNNIVLCLKTAHTLLTFPKGTIYLNTMENSGMATAGSGDVLAGVLGASMALAQKTTGYSDDYVRTSTDEQVMNGVVHSPIIEQHLVKGLYTYVQAGDKARQKTSESHMMARDIIEHL